MEPRTKRRFVALSLREEKRYRVVLKALPKTCFLTPEDVAALMRAQVRRERRSPPVSGPAWGLLETEGELNIAFVKDKNKKPFVMGLSYDKYDTGTWKISDWDLDEENYNPASEEVNIICFCGKRDIPKEGDVDDHPYDWEGHKHR